MQESLTVGDEMLEPVFTSSDEESPCPFWNTYDGDPEVPTLDDIEEVLWSRSYETFIRFGNIQHREFNALKIDDIMSLREEFLRLRMRSFEYEAKSTEWSILQDEIIKTKEEVMDLCPHLTFEAEYIDGDNSKYECSLCKFSYREIHKL